jgi:DNA-binding NarL/FixJ family response regulator
VIRVLFVEDDPRYRASIEALLTYTPGFALAAAFGRADTALAWARAGAWDLCVCDLNLDGHLDGIEVIAQLKALAPDRPIVALTVFEEPAVIVRAICAGADGYLLKRSSSSELIALLRSAADHGAPLTTSVARTVLDVFRRSVSPAPSDGARLDLTKREQEVLRKLVDGLAYKEVADRLEISLDSVRTHVRAIYRKLQVHSVSAAVSRALRDGLV